jgi:hypothetical protein
MGWKSDIACSSSLISYMPSIIRRNFMFMMRSAFRSMLALLSHMRALHLGPISSACPDTLGLPNHRNYRSTILTSLATA